MSDDVIISKKDNGSHEDGLMTRSIRQQPQPVSGGVIINSSNDEGPSTTQ